VVWMCRSAMLVMEILLFFGFFPYYRG